MIGTNRQGNGTVGQYPWPLGSDGQRLCNAEHATHAYVPCPGLLAALAEKVPTISYEMTWIPYGIWDEKESLSLQVRMKTGYDSARMSRYRRWWEDYESAPPVGVGYMSKGLQVTMDGMQRQKALHGSEKRPASGFWSCILKTDEFQEILLPLAYELNVILGTLAMDKEVIMSHAVALNTRPDKPIPIDTLVRDFEVSKSALIDAVRVQRAKNLLATLDVNLLTKGQLPPDKVLLELCPILDRNDSNTDPVRKRLFREAVLRCRRFDPPGARKVCKDVCIELSRHGTTSDRPMQTMIRVVREESDRVAGRGVSGRTRPVKTGSELICAGINLLYGRIYRACESGQVLDPAVWSESMQETCESLHNMLGGLIEQMRGGRASVPDQPRNVFSETFEEDGLLEEGWARREKGENTE